MTVCSHLGTLLDLHRYVIQLIMFVALICPGVRQAGRQIMS